MRTIEALEALVLCLSEYRDTGYMAGWDKPFNQALEVLAKAPKDIDDPETIDEAKEAAIGATLARVFQLKRSPDFPDRWFTSVGTKSDIGVYRTTVGILKDHKHYAQEI